MKALSIRQPWAHLIIYGDKDIENRTWSTKYRGPILIHAALKKSDADKEDAEAFIHGHFASPIRHLIEMGQGHLYGERGGIVGSAILADVVTQSDSPWFTGPYGFVLTDVKPRPFRPLRGMLGLFEVPDADL